MARQTEINVYLNLVNYCINGKWQVICASPPAGTDNRFKKCLLPRRDLAGNEKGPRDEVDLTACKSDVAMFVECKTTLSESLNSRNALGESDYEKLKRILSSINPHLLASHLKQSTGFEAQNKLRFAAALAVAKLDCKPPTDMTVFEFAGEQPRILSVSPLIELV
jgi:Holliday junction resolvase-like predicted endonuclease